MSDDDRRVKGRTNEEVRAIAERTKSAYGVTRRRPVDILKCLESGSVQTIYGRKELVFRVVRDDELSANGKTEFAKSQVIITVRQTVRDDARMGVGRARMTLAHELAHAVMHHGTPLFRLLNAAGSTDLAKEAAYSSAEHQAKVFAAAFLIHDEDAAQMQSAEEISIEFGVSLEAAKICIERLQEKEDRAKSAARVARLAAEAKAAILGKPEAKAPTFLETVCGTCHNYTLLPIGSNKVLCDTCGFVGDRFQDGDEA